MKKQEVYEKVSIEFDINYRFLVWDSKLNNIKILIDFHDIKMEDEPKKENVESLVSIV